MKKINSKFALFALAAVVVVSSVISCKKKFDEPPTFVEPNITANMTIRELKALHTIVGAFDTVKVDKIISGIVVADDKSGNLYKSINIADSTGGITLRLESASLYTSYPVGRKIYIKVKDLVLGDYGGLIQLGGSVDYSDPTRPGLATLAAAFFDKYIIKGSSNNAVVPKTVTMTQLGTSMQDDYLNTLIKLDNVEFVVSDTSKTYADPTKAASAVNLTVKNCAGSTIIVRTSSYANFAALNVPNGNGSLTAVYTIFNGTKQLVIRDTSDVQFNGTRCVAAASNLVLGTSPLLLDFDNISAGLPVGVTVRTGATASNVGTTGSFGTPPALWNAVNSGFKNFASANTLAATTDSATQVNASNRAVGVRQTSATDLGVAFVFEIANTTGKNNLKLDFNLQSLDNTSPRVSTWTVDYGIGSNPTSFTPATTTGVLTTGGNIFSNNPVSATFGTALNNVNNTIFVRIVVLGATSGGGNRASTAIDNVKFSWN